MAYSEAKVIAGGLAHIPIIIGLFWLIRSYFNKRINNFDLAQKPTKLKTPLKKVENKVTDLKKPENKATETNKVANKVSNDAKLENKSSKSISSEIKTVPPKPKKILKLIKSP